MTLDQFHSLYQLLRHDKVGSQTDQVIEDSATANCANISKSYISVSLNSLTWILDLGSLERITSDFFSLSFYIEMLPKLIDVILPNSLNVLVF